MLLRLEEGSAAGQRRRQVVPPVIAKKLAHVAARHPVCKTCNLDPLNKLTDDLRAARNGNADKPDIDAIVESVVTNNAYVHSILEKLGVSAAEPSAAPRKSIPLQAI